MDESTTVPRRLVAAVACVASAMLLLEIVVTRLFSVLFFYHFSFFAISLVMSGLVIGGILASRWDARGMSEEKFAQRLGALAALLSIATAAALGILVAVARPDVQAMPSPPGVALYAFLFLPGLVGAGAFLALAFARNREWIGTLYAWDLIAAGAACIFAVVLLRTLQGPATLLVPVLLGAVAAWLISPSRMFRLTGLVLGELALAAGIIDVAAGHALLRLRTNSAAQPILERWNEHSRVQAFDRGAWGRNLVIDRSAATTMRPLPPRTDGQPVEPAVKWGFDPQYPVYRLGRPVREVAVIGVGGGQDLLPALVHGARSIDGYELNGIFIDLLERDYRDFNAVTTRPEVHLIHDEARVGITHSGKRYDVIQASLIDTWAATASGGVVLSENGLYTREAWRTFLEHLSDRGVLTMTRWYLPDAPAETHRLVSLAASALEDAGIPDAARHLVLIRSHRNGGTSRNTRREEDSVATILISRTPFAPDEVRRLGDAMRSEVGEIMAAPGIEAVDSTIGRLLSSATRRQAVHSSPFDISPPTDLKPYFFLQLRPGDLFKLSEREFGSVTQITFNGVRVMVLLAISALGLVLLALALTAFGLPGAAASASQRRTYRRMTFYFLGIGLGYILVQLAFHQRLIIVLGHPTLALSIVLFCMLLGTGFGSAWSGRLFPSGRFGPPALCILGTLAVLWLSLPFVPLLERVETTALRLGIVAGVIFGVGFVLGFAFPLGIRRVAPTGEWATQKMWAINGAASIAAAVLAALLGLLFGTAGVLGFGLLAYGIAVAAGLLSEEPRVNTGSPIPSVSGQRSRWKFLPGKTGTSG